MAIRRPAAVIERDLLVAYPFLPGAEAVVGELATSLRDVVEQPVFARAREIGRARVRSAVDDPTGALGVEELDRATGEERFLSFLYAWLVLSALPTRAPLRRWAVAEAKGSHSRLRGSSAEELVEVARRLGHQFESIEAGIDIALPDYLRLAVPVREAEFRLVRQDLRRGHVSVSRERAARLLQEGIRLHLAEPFTLETELRQLLQSRESDFAQEILGRVPTQARRGAPGILQLQPEIFPPCIRKMKRMLEAGENLSHAGRFALAAFLHRVGADFETIVDAYRGAPDFDEGVTRYQAEHITRREGGRGYEPPECDKLRSHGLCFREGDPVGPTPVDRARDEMCFRPELRHPLQYYRWKGGWVAERAEADTEAAVTRKAEAARRRGEPGPVRSTGPR